MIDGRVVGKPVDHASCGRLRALYEWLKPATPSPHLPSSPASEPDREDLPARIGQYAIQRKLGQGGMGVVYAARDERLKRTVALKVMSSLANDELARTRFWREARVAASVNHPNVCQIYEISEDHGELFIAMELLEGEALSERLRKGPLSIADALPIEFGILAALSALHALLADEHGCVLLSPLPGEYVQFLLPQGRQYPGGGERLPGRALLTAAELGGEGVSQARSLQQSRQGRSFCRLGTAEDLYGRTARGIQITARIAEQSTSECFVVDGRPGCQRRIRDEAQQLVDVFVP